MKIPSSTPPRLNIRKPALYAAMVLFMFASAIRSTAQLTPCQQAESLGSSPVCKDSAWTFTGEKWFSFVADSSNLSISVLNSADTTDGHAHIMVLYSGSCGNETFIASDALSGPTDHLLEIDTNIFIPGNTYLIQIYSDETGCDKGCGEGSARYEICINTLPLLRYLNMSLAASFIDRCGLNYCMNGVRLNQRPTNIGFGQTQPAAISISCIPPGASVIAAYLYFITVGNTPLIQNVSVVNPNNASAAFAAQVTGGGGGRTGISATCWPGFSTTTTGYVANITTHITGNGNYIISGLPVFNIFSSPPFVDTDGATLLIIYGFPCDGTKRPGKLYLYDGLSLIESFQTNSFNMAYTSYGNNINESYFYAIGDIQGSGGGNTNTNTNFGTTNHVNQAVFWESVSQPTNLAPNSNNSNVVHTNAGAGGDCSSIPFIGVYTQDGDNLCSQVMADAGPDKQICIIGGVPPTLNGSATLGCLPYSYSWAPAASLSNSSIANPIASPTVNTTYTLTVTDCDGCTSTDVVNVTLDPGPDPTITGIQSNPCDGNFSSYSSVCAPGINYTWYYCPGVIYPQPCTTLLGTGCNVAVTWPASGGQLILEACDPVTGCCATDTVYIMDCCNQCPSPISLCLDWSNKSASWVLSNPAYAPYINGNVFSTNGATGIVINGQFTVDVNFTLLNQFEPPRAVLMSANSTIQINPGVTFTVDNSTLKPCNVMWGGIYVNGNTATFISRNNSDLIGARNAVVSNAGGILNITNTDFVNNYKAIIVNAYNGPSNIIIHSNTFRSVNPFGTALPPLPFNTLRGHSGVEVYDNTSVLTIGDAASLQTVNRFWDLEAGIKFFNTNGVVVNGSFQGIFLNPNHPNSGTGIYARAQKIAPKALRVGGFGANERCVIRETRNGILADNYIGLLAENNIIANTASILGSAGILVRFCNNQQINLNQNTVTRHAFAIFLRENPNAVVDINGNIINGFNHPNPFGIRVENAILSQMDVNIRLNTITRCRNGIRMINTTSMGGNRPRIRYNTVNTTFSDIAIINSSLVHRGIHALNCPDVFIDVNQVNRTFQANSSAVEPLLFGIHAWMCPNSIISNNYVENHGYGIHVQDICPASQLTCNQLVRNRFGFFFTSADVGPQYNGMPNDNLYANTSNGAHSLVGDHGGLVIPGVSWDYRSSQNWYVPNIFASGLLQNINNGITGCSPVMPPLVPPQRAFKWQETVLDTTQFTDFTLEKRLWKKRAAYGYFKNNPGDLILNSPDDPMYLNFYSQEQQGTTGTYYSFLDAIASGNVSLAGQINAGYPTSEYIDLLRNEANHVYLGSWAVQQNSFAQADSSFLRSILSSNPIESGDAYFTALVMLGDTDMITDNMQREFYTNEEDLLEKSPTLTLFPSPTKEFVYLDDSRVADKSFKLEIYNALGMLVFQRECNAEESLPLKLGPFLPGYYAVSLRLYAGELLSGKIVVIK